MTRNKANERRLRPTVTALEGRPLLATFTVTSVADDGSTGTLRWAVGQANQSGEADTIAFSSLFNTPRTITLTGGQFTLTDPAATTITGPGANLLAVSGNNVSRVFEIIPNAAASISGLTITGGNAGQFNGGGLYNSRGTLSLTDCTVSGNTVSSQSVGGGLCNQAGTVTLTNCTISGNTAGTGGGLDNFSGTGPATMTLTNCTVTGNTADLCSGVNILGGTAFLTNCTVSGNTAQNPYGAAVVINNSTVTLTNTIVARNGSGDVAGSYLGRNNLIGGDPLLAPLGDYGGPTPTMALLPGSPAIGQGTMANDPSTGQPITTDQRGLKLGTPTPDIGAFQSQRVAVNTTTFGGIGSPSGILTLRQALNLAEVLGGAGEITFDPTLFATHQTITLDGTPIEPPHGFLKITGPGANLLTLSGNNASRVFQFGANVAASISGLTVSGGQANRGGGLYNKGGNVSLTDCTFSGNSSTGSYNYGGGLLNDSGTLSLAGCTITGNSSRSGGGLQVLGGTVSLTGCTVLGNSATSGGGLGVQGGTLSLTNCTIVGNSATDGGGLESLTGTTTLTNCTVVGNSATSGGGLSVDGGTVTLTNTIAAGNSTAVPGGNPDIFGNVGGSNNLVGGNPLLAPLGDYGGPTRTMALLPGSPAIGGGTATGAPTTDQRGQPRSGHIDVGAVQSQGFILTPISGSSPQSATVNRPFQNPLAVTVTPNNPLEPVNSGVVAFAAPTSGASATLSAATAVIAGGHASVTAQANTTPGSYSVTTSAAGVTTAASFALSNTPGAAASIAVVSGSSQTATVAAHFAAPLVVVVKDAFGNPVPQVTITFAPPATGASATLTGLPAVTDASGQARVTATAGKVEGFYTVTASVAGVTTAASFPLFNFPGDAASVTIVSGSGQAAAVTTRFAAPLVVVVKDAFGNPVPQVTVAFAPPATGASATLTGSPAVTDANGQARVTATAGTIRGSYTVTASVTGVTTAARFALSNTEAPSGLLTTTRDVVNALDGLISLREAIAFANRHPGPDIIAFAPAVSGKRAQTIQLTGGPLVLTDRATTTILGPGATLLTLRGDGRSRVLDIRGGSVALSGLTIAGGRADQGAGIRNDRGMLSLTRVILRNNTALALGGGLLNTGSATLNRVIITGNRARVGGGLANLGFIALNRVTFRGNLARVASRLFTRRPATPTT